jgi:lipoprotein NlpI
LKLWIKHTLVAASIGLLSACALAPTGGSTELEKPVLPADYAAALKLLENQQWNAAQMALLAYAEKHPRQSSPQVNLALLYRRMGKHDEAKAALAKALEINPKQAAAYNLMGIYARESGDFKAAKAAYGNAISANPAYPNAHLNLAILLDLYELNTQAAMAHYQKYADLIGADALDQDVKSWIADATRQTQRKP